jgi:CrcB protein
MLVALLAGVGSVLRYLVDRSVPPSRFPRGTVLVNTTGSFALGLVAGGLHGRLATVVGVGLLGGYTTLSTYAVETVALLERRRVAAALLNVLGSAVLGLAAAAAGLALAGLLT